MEESGQDNKKKWSAMLMMDGVEITSQQLDEFKAALEMANHEMEVTTRHGNQVKEIFPICADKII